MSIDRTALVALIVAVLHPWSSASAFGQQDQPTSISIGMEYVLPGLGETLAETGAPAVKFIPDQYRWGKMQRRPAAAIDFRVTDQFVREYQGAGFEDLVFALKSHSSWASKKVELIDASNPSPRPEHMDAYADWVAAVVERYDGDGDRDMPGLRRPVRHFEIGSEYSSYEPEPPAEYLAMLARAYRAAHGACRDVLIAHAAFFDRTMYVDIKKRRPNNVGGPHSLADVLAILDRPDIFDVVNFHALMSPYEIDDTVEWLRGEMGKRGYSKPIMISDTAPNPIIGLGGATTCEGPTQSLGIVFPPATEEDRCRAARYFAKLVEGDEKALRWTQTFTARDMVQKVVIAAGQGVMLINTAFTEDLGPLLTSKLFRASAGTSPWAGMVKRAGRRVVERRPAFYALQQLVGHLEGYASITRLLMDAERVRVYELTRPGGERLWIAWLDPERLLLPGDDVPRHEVSLPVGGSAAIVEPMISSFGQESAVQTKLETSDGAVTLTITPAPAYIWAVKASAVTRSPAETDNPTDP